ncbi:MAG TPA: lysophospholipid acyltransferase family protein [Gaiellaceae bacterium]|nr:lysophospholipid acyltransferase family protein [Gaiellaceae bacterium]
MPENSKSTAGSSAARTVSVAGPLTRLGVPRLWGNDPELLWRVVLSRVAAPAVRFLAPSYGYGVERMPASGGAVLAANHLAAIDHPLLGLFSRRTIFFVSKEELLRIPLVGELISWTGAFPVRRGEVDREALRRACALVREGHVVGVHPEGTRQRTGYPGTMKPGAVLIALLEGVPVVPAGLETFRWSARNRRPCAVVFGEPLTFDDLPPGRERRARALERVEREIVRLWRLAAQAVAEGFPERLPDGSLRHGPLRPEERL